MITARDGAADGVLRVLVDDAHDAGQVDDGLLTLALAGGAGVGIDGANRLLDRHHRILVELVPFRQWTWSHFS